MGTFPPAIHNTFVPATSNSFISATSRNSSIVIRPASWSLRAMSTRTLWRRRSTGSPDTSCRRRRSSPHPPFVRTSNPRSTCRDNGNTVTSSQFSFSASALSKVRPDALPSTDSGVPMAMSRSSFVMLRSSAYWASRGDTAVSCTLTESASMTVVRPAPFMPGLNRDFSSAASSGDRPPFTATSCPARPSLSKKFRLYMRA